MGEAAGDAEVIFAYDNVRLYFISPDGSVSSSSEPERMIIVHFSGMLNLYSLTQITLY